MINILPYFILVPLLAFVLSIFLPKKRERLISGLAFLTVGAHFAGAWAFIAYWFFHGRTPIDVKGFILFPETSQEFFIDFYFDKITAVYLFVGSFLTFLITIYSRYYMHRESGFKRFFTTLLFFYLGNNIIIFSGNLETLCVGWELMGLSSFLLIAFYRDRYLPVKNAVKVFSIYRIGDIGILLAMWMSHHLWHENITFAKLNGNVLVHDELQNHSLIGVFISMMILMTAAAKSAQLPFSSWLPKAMEGPTPSSAIFYGSLAVHLGVFILLRTFDLWENQVSVRIFIAVLGLSTSMVATGIARVQSSVKSKIAYSSITQIGLIFAELAAGWEDLALIHFAGNAFLRTYQLLVSPSVVTYLIREQFYNFTPPTHSKLGFIPKKIRYTAYMLCLKEWYLELFMYHFYWNPFKWAGRKLNFLGIRGLIMFFIPMYIVGLICLYTKASITAPIQEYLPTCISLIGLMMVLKSFTERKNAFMSWVLILMNHFWIALAISFNEEFKIEQIAFYLSGIMVSYAVGYYCLNRLRSLEKSIELNRFLGHSYEHPKLAVAFLLSCLGIMGFPITPSFIGEDVIFSHIHEEQLVLAFFTSLSFIINGLSVMRIYARIFLGPHIKTYHDIAYRSS
ncbi:MAG TPA: proton-conducting transporter membrane subunit [Bacteroidia bacterium]|jgi:NADH-quinone oxidoreductase subunit L|nr:proton-conducting transporter membrane subunit [Bacteroidia bacterium]